MEVDGDKIKQNITISLSLSVIKILDQKREDSGRSEFISELIINESS